MQVRRRAGRRLSRMSDAADSDELLMFALSGDEAFIALNLLGLGTAAVPRVAANRQDAEQTMAAGRQIVDELVGQLGAQRPDLKEFAETLRARWR